MKKQFLFILFTIFSFSILAQNQLTWGHLADVTFQDLHDSENLITYNKATFGKKLIRLDSTEVYISGYIIPIDPMGISYVLSKNPNATCFFCGAAGPETVIQLMLKPSAYQRYATDTKLTFKGILKLNELNADGLTYILLNAEEK